MLQCPDVIVTLARDVSDMLIETQCRIQRHAEQLDRAWNLNCACWSLTAQSGIQLPIDYVSAGTWLYQLPGQSAVVLAVSAVLTIWNSLPVLLCTAMFHPHSVVS